MSRLFKLFKIPGPKDLGKANNNNALPSELFGFNNPGDYTWERYYQDIKEMFPIKYLFAKAIPDFLTYKVWLPIKRPISDFYWAIKYKCVPKYRYHKLDLRQPPGACDHYKYGWRDVPEKILYANFNLLKQYIEGEEPYDLSSDYTLEDIYADAGLKQQYQALEEAKFLLHWWKVIRKQKFEEKQKIIDDAYDVRASDRQKFEELMDQYRDLDQRFDDEEEEMLIRLIKIRKTLWT